MTIHRARIHPASTWTLACLGSLSIAATCQPTNVPIPDPSTDQPPAITVSAVASAGTGTVAIDAATPGNCASPCKNAVTVSNPGVNDTADIVLVVQAKNPGGVKSIAAVVSQGGNTLYSVARGSSPDAQGHVPTMLQIWGTDGAGGIGTEPLLIHLSKFVAGKTGANVKVTASNYHGQSASYTVTYLVEGQPQVGGSIATEMSFTCADAMPVSVVFQTEGECHQGCTKPNSQSSPSFMEPVNDQATCSGGTGSMTVFSQSNLQSGTWTVKVTPNMPVRNLVPPYSATCTNVPVQAAKATRVHVLYEQKRDLTWGWTCQTSP